MRMTLIKSNKGDAFPKLFSDFFDGDDFFTNRWFEREFKESLPAVNIKENGTEFKVELAVPGFKKDEFKVHVENDLLTISAEKKEEKKEEGEKYTRKEYSYNSFSRSFNIPKSANGDAVVASYTDGILQLSIPKKQDAQQTKKKEIKVG